MKKAIILLPFSLLFIQQSFSQKIYTIAGNGFQDYSGNGGLATAAQFYNPNGVARDDSGNIYIVDQGNNCVRRINASNGNTVLYAGNSTPGYSGDNGLAVSAELNSPASVACDRLGNVYIADAGNSLVREVNNHTRKIVYVAGYAPKYKKPISGYIQNQDGGLADSAELNYPDGLAVDYYGNIYISDMNNQRIRYVHSGIITSICGRDSIAKNGNQLLGPNGLWCGDGHSAFLADIDNPAGLALDSYGNLYIADAGNYRIRVISGGIINTLCGSNSPTYNGDHVKASAANLDPIGVTIDTNGNLYITDQSNNRIRMINLTTDTIYTVAGTGTASYGGDGGPATAAMLNEPGGILADSGKIFFIDDNNMRLREIKPNDTIVNYAGCGTGGYSGNMTPSFGSSIRYPNQLVLDSNGNLYFADQINNAVREIKKYGATLQNDTIITIAGNGTKGYSGDNNPATAAMLNAPSSVAADRFGNIYIADVGNNVVRKVHNDTITTYAGTGVAGYSGDNGLATAAQLHGPYAVAVDLAGNVYVADNINYRIRKINKLTGNITTVAGNGTQGYNGDNKPATAAELSSPVGLSVDAGGNLYISDKYNDIISKVNGTGTITTIAGNGYIGFTNDDSVATKAELDNPGEIAVDKSGNVFVADMDNNVIREINNTGKITTVAGTATAQTEYTVALIIVGIDTTRDTTFTKMEKGLQGFWGDGHAPDSAKLNLPDGIAVDNSGNLYISDYANHRIREVTTAVLNGIAQVKPAADKTVIYPNPSGGAFTMASPLVPQTVDIYNILGEKISTTLTRGGITQFNISSQPAGIYLYRVISQTGAMLGSGKLIIEK